MSFLLYMLLTMSALMVGCADDNSGENPLAPPPPKVEPLVEGANVEGEANAEEAPSDGTQIEEANPASANASPPDSPPNSSDVVIVAPILPGATGSDGSEQHGESQAAFDREEELQEGVDSGSVDVPATLPNRQSSRDLVANGGVTREDLQNLQADDGDQPDEASASSNQEEVSESAAGQEAQENGDREVQSKADGEQKPGQEVTGELKENVSGDSDAKADQSEEGESDTLAATPELDSKELTESIEEALSTLQEQKLEQPPEVVLSLPQASELDDGSNSDEPSVNDEEVDLTAVLFTEFEWVELSSIDSEPAPFSYELNEEASVQSQLDITGEYSQQREVVWGLLPKCISNMNPESLVSVLRGNWLTRIFADPNYKPIDLSLPLAEVRKQTWKVPEEIPDNLDDWQWQMDSEEGQVVNDVYSITFSDFYDLNTQSFNDPTTVAVKQESPPSNYDEEVIKHLESLKLCDQF